MLKRRAVGAGLLAPMPLLVYQIKASTLAISQLNALVFCTL
jgi:hypothetical protein